MKYHTEKQTTDAYNSMKKNLVDLTLSKRSQLHKNTYTMILFT